MILLAALGLAGCMATSFDQKPTWVDVPAASRTVSDAASQPSGDDPGARSGNRILVAAQINSQPVLLMLDSGSQALIVWRRTAKKLGWNLPVGGGGLLNGPVVAGNLTVWNKTAPVSFSVIAAPPGSANMQANSNLPRDDMADVDGILPLNIFYHNSVQIDAADAKAWLLQELPPDIKNWTAFRMAKVPLGSYLTPLAFIATWPDGYLGEVNIDTGDPRDITFSPSDWKAWKAQNPNARLTYAWVTEQSMAGQPEFVTDEESWTKEFDLGSLKFTEAMVGSNQSFLAKMSIDLGGSYMMLGLQALKQFDVIVDGVDGLIYFRAKQIPPNIYPHNRLGAVFLASGLDKPVPMRKLATIGDDAALSAKVAPGSPAYEAGIRDGDILLGIDGYDRPTTGLRAMLTMPQFFYQPAGTQLTLHLKRGGQEFTANVILRDIVGPMPEKTGTDKP